MIEATCAACGTVARIAEADVPAGAKFINCASCKSRVPLPGKAATPVKGMKVPSIPIPKIAPPPPIPGKPKADTLDLADLPAPKRNSPLAGTETSAKPAQRSALADAELPIPKSAKPPAPAPGALDLDELMPPSDLPAPKAKAELGITDLPAPKPKASALADLPAPKAKQASALADLPAPKAKPGPLADLPAPKPKAPPAPAAPVARGFDDDLDLPAPKPSGLSDLPAPKGFFDDLPQPAKPKDGSIDLPAPKGFFDDLPAPVKGGGKAGSQDVAPKGFFDDLPAPAKQSQDVAPKGFFDDLPAPKAGAKGGLFDDLPQPTKPAPAGAAPGGGLFDDLPQPTGNDGGMSLGNDLDLAGGSSLDLDGGAGPELDLGLPLGQDQQFQDLDLGEPLKGPSTKGIPDEPPSPIKIKTPAKGAAPATPITINVPKNEKPELKLDLADDPHGGAGAPTKKAGGTAAVAGKGGSKKKTPEEIAAEREAKKKRTQIVLGSVLGLAALGAGGFYMYKRHAAQQARAEQISTSLDGARRALVAEAPNHWSNAATQAQKVIEIDPTNTQALGLAAEAAIGGALDTGINGEARIRAGRKFLQDGLGAGKITPELERAQAISFIAANQPDKAIPRLKTLSGQKPKDGFLQLYLGWAELAAGDADEALKAFDQAVANTKATKIPALYGHGRAKLMLGDMEGAKTSFATILETQKGHICAQVQLAATLPPSKSAQREADLKALLETKEVQGKQADPRCVAQAYTQLGDVARTNGRLDIARENYRKATALVATDIGALVGLARVEMRDNKLPLAADLVQKAIASNANSPSAQIASAELNVLSGKLPDAEKQIADLGARKPPLAKMEQVQLGIVKGKLLEAQGKDDEAVDAYAEAAKLAGDLDLTPTMMAVTKLADLGNKSPDPAKQQAYRQRADALLSALAARAQEDAQLSTQIGVAYLQAGDASKAEMFLRRAVEMREDDPEAKLQLGKALSALGRTDDAVEQIKNAIKLDPNRMDFKLELALIYQRAGRDDEAIKAYDELLKLPDVPLIVRANAGRFFVKKGLLDRKPELIEKGAAQSEPILSVEPENAAGLYLKGEGLLLKNKPDEAAPALTKATDIDPEAQYLDALGRAMEARIASDSKFIEGARVAYERATKADPKLAHALLGLGHMWVLQGHHKEALAPLLAAKNIDGNNSELQYWTGESYYGTRNDSDANTKATEAGAALWLEAALHKGKPELPLDLRADAARRLGQIYFDLNKGPLAAANYQLATELGEELENQKGITPTWLTESYYDLGALYRDLGNYSAQKRAYIRYLDRKPKSPERVQEAQNALATSLQRY